MNDRNASKTRPARDTTAGATAGARIRDRAVGLGASFSSAGMLLGALFFAAALTPSLLPRSSTAEGLLAGCAAAVGYGIGVLLCGVWVALGRRALPERIAHRAMLVAAAVSLTIVLQALRSLAPWQNSIRELMHLPPVALTYDLQVVLVALVTFGAVMAVARLFRWIALATARGARRFASRRWANVVGVLVASVLFWSVLSGVLFRAGLHIADSSYRELDALLEPERPQPTAPQKTGSSASLLRWSDLGRAGREFVATATTADALRGFSGRRAREPIRVYVGRRSADSAQARAALALAELKRVGAFDRSVLVVITPTGTGWVDPAAATSLEYVLNGDVASVAVQYSYLASALSLLVEPDYGAETARALFSQVYAYWTTLPKGRRPRLYLHGLSLGAMNSERSTDLIEILGDPFDGALWSGPPYASSIWKAITAGRDPASPAWLPRFRDDALVRFLNQDGFGAPPDARWGPLRIVYLQYASDPITFFEERTFYRRPDWLSAARGPDVSRQLRWYPMVTFFQLLLDISLSNHAPVGYGHVFAPAHYVTAWIAVTGARDWSAEDIVRMKRHLTEAARTVSGPSG